MNPFLQRMNLLSRSLARRFVPRGTRRALVRATRIPPVGTVDLGDLRRLEPVSRSWGGDRGLPVDRYYIEQFLALHSRDIRGRLLNPAPSESPLPRTRTPSVLRALRNSGTVEIGGHTRTHPDLAELEVGDQEAEVHGSRSALEEILDTPVGRRCIQATVDVVASMIRTRPSGGPAGHPSGPARRDLLRAGLA